MSQRLFCDFAWETRDQRVQRDDFSRPIGQREKFGVAGTPHLFGRILDRGHLVVRHHFLQIGQRRQQFGGALQLELAFGAQILEGQYGIARIFLDCGAHLFFGSVTHDGQRGKRERGNQQGQREE